MMLAVLAARAGGGGDTGGAGLDGAPVTLEAAGATKAGQVLD